MGAVCLALAACDGQAPAPEVDVAAELAAINLTPKTLEEAEAQFARLDTLSKQSGGDPRVLAATRKLADNVEPLNGLVDKISVGERHSVSFYANGETFSVSEDGPQGMIPKVMPLLQQGLSFADVFRTLAPGRAMPAALLKAPAAQISDGLPVSDLAAPGFEIGATAAAAADGVTTTQSALTAEDGPWFADNVCPTTGSLKWCHLNWNGNNWADSGGKYTTSYFRIAPYAGDPLNVRRIWEGKLQNTLTVYQGELKFYYQQGKTYSDCTWYGVCSHHYYKGRHRWEITNAAGDWYHWGGNMFNEPVPGN